MPERNLDSAGNISNGETRDDLTDIAETLPAYDAQTAPPDYASRAPSIVETQPETRWTGGPRGRNGRFINNLHPEDYYVMGNHLMSIPEVTPRPDLEPVDPPPWDSRRVLIELQVRGASWLAALAGFSSTIYTSVHVDSLKTAAAFCQLAALLPLCYDSWRILVLVTERRSKKLSSGKAWYFNLICTIGAGVGCWFLWTTGVRDGVFEPFGRVGAVTMAIAFMAANGAFRFLYFLVAITKRLCVFFLESEHPANRSEVVS